MKNFVMKYGKWVAIAVVVISFGLLAIPGFFKLTPNSFNGYEMIFRFKFEKGSDFNWLASNGNNSVCTIGIVALVFALLSGVSVAFDKKSCALDILSGVLLVFSGIVFLSMQAWAVICYKRTNLSECSIGAVSYVIGALQLLVGAMITYKGFSILKEEKSNPKAVTYSYLKKNNK